LISLPKLKNCFEELTLSGWKGIPGILNSHLIIIVFKGLMKVKLKDGSVIKADGNHHLCIPSGEFRHAFCDTETLSFRLRFEQSHSSFGSFPTPTTIQPLLQQLKELRHTPHPNNATLDHLLAAVLCELSKPSIGISSDVTPERSQVMKIWVEQALGGQMNVTQGANALGLSSDHFSRIFKQIYGQSPKKYLMNLRLNKIAELLLEEDVLIKELAIRFGIGDPSLLGLQFKRHFGCSPGEYRLLNLTK
jgi:AraC-like DNA-binding protein